MSEPFKNKLVEVGFLGSFLLFILVIFLTALAIKPQKMSAAQYWSDDVMTQETAIVTLHMQYAANQATE